MGWCAPGTMFVTGPCFPRKHRDTLAKQLCTVVSIERVRESSKNKWFDAYVLASPSGQLVKVEKFDTIGAANAMNLVWWVGYERWKHETWLCPSEDEG